MLKTVAGANPLLPYSITPLLPYSIGVLVFSTNRMSEIRTIIDPTTAEV